MKKNFIAMRDCGHNVDCKSPGSAPADCKSAGTGLLKSFVIAYYRLFYFFFRIEKWSSGRIEKTDSHCAFMAILPLILFGFIDLLFLEYLFSRFIFNVHIIQYKTNAIIIGVLSSIFNGIVFFRNKKYLMIKEMFSNECDEKRRKRTLFCIIYSLFTLFGIVILINAFGYPT